MQDSAQNRPPAQSSAQPQPPAHAPITPARSAAFAILLRVADTSAHSDDLLHGPGMSALSQADRNLAHTLVLGVLRWQIALDARMLPLLQRPDQALPTPVATALRMGAFQLLHLDRIPAHAALSESVELVRAAGHPHAAGMVNAILRKLTRQPGVPSGRSLSGGVSQLPARPKLYETTAAFADRLAHPLWLVDRWVQNYGRTAALAICAHDQAEPDDASLFTHAPDLPHLDDGSRLVAELAAAAHPAAAHPGSASSAPTRIWDTCAAPGGKTLILAARHPSAPLLATDANPRRLQALTTRLEATARQTKTLPADATALPETEGLFDLILCDVPCSGTGTLSRNPEIRHRLQPSDLARQATRQREILTAALARLAPGGHLLYSTCSLEPEENEQVVAAALAAVPNIITQPLDPILNHLITTGLLTTAPTGLLRNGQLRTLPGANFRGDGFFAALLHRP
ncbi:MAG TPA: transcription antitermination factor NusB [Acidobacteriaceae bacterium]|nr:transcription antitermination factor NusB [Acidobacteriaceae bacterium]